MLRTTCVRLVKRKKSPYVHKYLEGVPVPRKLLGHLTGADLTASSSVNFFTTTPRYIRSERGNPLSRLFFHHVLYPAGGARAPYQVVVVRGGRGVMPSQRLMYQHEPVSDSARQQRKADPLAVPLHREPDYALSASAAPDNCLSSQSWRRADPARRTFFYSPNGVNSGDDPFHYEMNVPRLSVSHSPPSSLASRTRSPSKTCDYSEVPAQLNSAGHLNTIVAPPVHAPERCTRDTALLTLCSVIEECINKGRSGTGNESKQSGEVKLEGVHRAIEAALHRPSAGLLRCSVDKEGSVHFLAAANSSLSLGASSGAGDILRDVFNNCARTALQRVARGRNNTDGSNPVMACSSNTRSKTHTYVMANLPSGAVVSLPLDIASSGPCIGLSSQRGAVALRLAGGYEPQVGFAVGSPLSSTSNGPSHSPTNIQESFGHIQCLLRVNISVSGHSSCSPPHDSDAHPCDSVVERTCEGKEGARIEPWRLGVALDPHIPYSVRTVSEGTVAGGPSNGGTDAICMDGRYLLGRDDAEIYLLPQREMLMRVYVPPSTAIMCAMQNEDRVRRQTNLGGVHHPSASAKCSGNVWDGTLRLTSGRVLGGRKMNVDAATYASSSTSANSDSVPSSPPIAKYDIRAFPGDVVYIPRGWAFEVFRTQGSAIVSGGSIPTTGKGFSDSTSSHVLATCHNTSLAWDQHTSASVARDTAAPSSLPTTTTNRRYSSVAASIVGGDTQVYVESAEVDALCLLYKPYPVLSEEQASVYIAANYVHRGVDDFYRKGGNRIYHKYE